MTNRPEPIPGVYRLCDLPVGTKFVLCRREQRTQQHTKGAYPWHTMYSDELVQVVEWPTRTYDGIPADDLDVVLRYMASIAPTGPPTHAAAERIRVAIARQENNNESV